jgi:hypothetical protein
MSQLAQDTCIRADQSGLGTASDGSSYTVNGTVTTAISSNEALITAANGFPSVFLSSQTTADINVLVRIRQISNVFDGTGPCFRCADGNNMYFVAAYAGTGGMVFAKLVSGGFSSLATGSFTLNTNTFHWMRVVMAGNHLQARMWADGDPEPGTWIIDTTDSTYGSAGRFGMSFNTYSGTGTDFDHITVTDNQSITTSTRTIPSTAALELTKTRTIGTNTAALLATSKRTISSTSDLKSFGLKRTITTTAALELTKTRTIPTSADLVSRGLTRSISTTAALEQTRNRTIPTSADLKLFGLTRTIPTSGAVLSTKTRTISTTASLVNVRIVPTSAALSRRQARTIPTSASVGTFVPNVTVSVRSGQASVQVRSGQAVIRVK